MKAQQGNVSRKGGIPVLVVDDEHRVFQSLSQWINGEAFSPIWVSGEHEGLEILGNFPDREWIVIVDLKSSGTGGGGFLHQARRIAPQAAVLVTGPLGPFLYKDGSFYELVVPNLRKQINSVLEGIVGELGRPGKGEKAGRHSPAQSTHKRSFGQLIGHSPAMNAVYRLIENLRGSTATVLIQGESGTGKELIARTIHEVSPRKRGPFVAINCGAIPGSLMESELFGHERGAFTGAVSMRRGKFEAARGGTLFLDEIGELDRELQVKLLRVLQEREFQRVGGNATHKTDVRIIAATSRDLQRAMEEGGFRRDLYYRLHVVPIHAPPLRERREDIPVLLEHFWGESCKRNGLPEPALSGECRDALGRYSYPGNIRELANVVERILVTCPRGVVAFENLPWEVREEAAGKAEGEELLRALPDGGITLKAMERELIVKSLEKTSGNKRAAARMLGITRRLLYLRLAEYGIS